MKLIKKKRDFILGILLGSLSIYFLIRTNIRGSVSENPPGGYFARPDVYLDLLLYILLCLSIITLLRSINFRREDVSELKETPNIFAYLTILALVIYAIVLPHLGFIISTFILTAFLVITYGIGEEKDRKEVGRNIKTIIGKGLAFSVILVASLYLVFSFLLNVNLP